ncbi:MAG: signal recognition particle-docking protein FtsY [Cyanothece sp. SIO1E1]|nr:signal recognition particle-docking protein FtsY [Cyanothece sp. SIO1E1]
MASFNWFRRQLEKPSTESQSNTTEPEPTQAETKTDDSEATDAPSEAVAEDYLSWAKTAYQNIQNRQQVQSLEPEPAPAPAPELEIEPKPESADVEAIAAPTAEPISPPTAAPTLSEEQPIAETVVKAEATAASTIASTSEVVVETPEAPPTAVETPIPAPIITAGDESSPLAEAPGQTKAPGQDDQNLISTPAPAATTAALPFWAKAETERQERLERLRETAIAAEPETDPPVATATAEVAEAEVPEFDLDEGFLWSAEILASQGRRPEDVSLEEINWLKRLRQGLDKTRRGLVNQLKAVVGQGPLNQDAVMEIEALLLQADVGIEATDYIIEALQTKLKQDALPPDEAIAYLKTILQDMLDRPLGKSYNAAFAPEKDTLNIWLMTGVNGAGKTTTIGKIAHLAKESDYNCLIAAADTFRAAAVEQVKAWGQRSGVEVIANPGKNTDPAAVVFDAITAAQSRDAELLLVDTAGRLQNKKNLMDELSKVRRIIDKKAPDAKVESLLVLDATLGQNGLRQAQVFSEAAQLSGVVLTKLDGTAKGGIALAIVQQLGLPIRFIGAGEGIKDLRPFSSYEFIEALLNG